MKQNIPLRSVLYIPADNNRALEKTLSLNADAFIFDLEDAVAQNNKTNARNNLTQNLNTKKYPNQHTIIRINDPKTKIGKQDLKAAIKLKPDGILIPKIQTKKDVKKILKLIKNYNIELWIMIETTSAIANINKIAKIKNKNPKLTTLILGTNDIAKETQTKITHSRIELITWISICILAAKNHKLNIIDGVFNNFKDTEQFKIQAIQAKNLGMDGKTLIHPSQINPCNNAFKPSQEEIEWAQNVIKIFKENPNKGAANLNGEMIEKLHIPIAQKIIDNNKDNQT